MNQYPHPLLGYDVKNYSPGHDQLYNRPGIEGLGLRISPVYIFSRFPLTLIEKHHIDHKAQQLETIATLQAFPDFKN